ncbi:hypothetical protein COLO4_12904 [Corchorus olitorius]|uniref:Leucine-rich repeat-containing N-terminal plant-type domain-containing protein n=1 Tax=Corchorus olitorius TaxID=93759 RepID=A0A1R3JZA8_9ROSI|nr:hypothetical protein COLO4_12904 [Corchorus olitorius]
MMQTEKDTAKACDLQVTTLRKITADLGYPLELSDAWSGNGACNDWRFIECDSDDNSISSIDLGTSHNPVFSVLEQLFRLPAETKVKNRYEILTGYVRTNCCSSSP